MKSTKPLLGALLALAMAGATSGCGSSVDPADDGSKPAAPVDPKKLAPPADLPKFGGPKAGKH